MRIGVHPDHPKKMKMELIFRMTQDELRLLLEMAQEFKSLGNSYLSEFQHEFCTKLKKAIEKSNGKS